MFDKRIQEIPSKASIVMSYPKIEYLMTGVIDARQNNKGEITLTFEDGVKLKKISEKYIEDFSLFQLYRFIKEVEDDKGGKSV